VWLLVRYFCLPSGRRSHLLLTFSQTCAVSRSPCVSFFICFARSPHIVGVCVALSPNFLCRVYLWRFRLGEPQSCSAPCFIPQRLFKTHTSTRAGRVRVNECMYTWEPALLLLRFSRRLKLVRRLVLECMRTTSTKFLESSLSPPPSLDLQPPSPQWFPLQESLPLHPWESYPFFRSSCRPLWQQSKGCLCYFSSLYFSATFWTVHKNAYI